VAELNIENPEQMNTNYVQQLHIIFILGFIDGGMTGESHSPYESQYLVTQQVHN